VSPPIDPSPQGAAPAASIRRSFSDNRLAMQLFGAHHSNLARIERGLDVTIHARGNHVTVSGREEQVKAADALLEALYARLRQGSDLTTGDVREIPVEHRSALLSPDGEHIAQFNADRTGLILSSVDGEKVQAWPLPSGLEAVSPLARLRYSPDGSRLVVTGVQNAEEESVILVYDL
jgi:hypothetical protein